MSKGIAFGKVEEPINCLNISKIKTSLPFADDKKILLSLIYLKKYAKFTFRWNLFGIVFLSSRLFFVPEYLKDTTVHKLTAFFNLFSFFFQNISRIQ